MKRNQTFYDVLIVGGGTTDWWRRAIWPRRGKQCSCSKPVTNSAVPPIASLNQYLLDPIESVMAPCNSGTLAIEVKSPLDLENDISLPRGNIFHTDLDFPFLDDHDNGANQQLWGAETDDPHIYLAGAGARRGGGVSGIAGHNAAMALLTKE